MRPTKLKRPTWRDRSIAGGVGLTIMLLVGFLITVWLQVVYGWN